MKINITEKTRRLYGEHCPYSTEKCTSISELDYKIQRCIDLGNHIKTYYDNNGNKLVKFRYHKKVFTLHKNEIIKIEKSEKCFNVSETRKINHYYRHNKVLV